MNCNKIVKELQQRRMFFGITFFPHMGTYIYVLDNGRMQYLCLPVVARILRDIHEKEDQAWWNQLVGPHRKRRRAGREFGRTRG